MKKQSASTIKLFSIDDINKKDAIEKIKCGADLVQLYTGFIYEGPSLIKRINNLLLDQELNKNYEK